MLKIVTVPNQVLTTQVQPIKNIDQKIQRLIKEMQTTLNSQTNPPGVGLAAPQIGESLSLFIIKPDEKAKIETFINPKIVEKQSPPTSSRRDIGTTQGQAQKESLKTLLNKAKRQTIAAFREKGVWKIGVDHSK